MTIEKAIEIKRQYQYILQDASLPELIEADNLSIESLKAVQKLRHYPFPDEILLLPGETKDE